VWAKKTGDASYTWSSFFPFFQRSVKLNGPSASVRPVNASVDFEQEVYASSTGPVQVSFANFANSISSYFGPALTQAGIKEIPGFLSGNLFGWQFTALSIDPVEQIRSSSETAYLSESFRDSTTNLYVYRSTLAKNIVFNGTTAIGVNVESGGVMYQLSAKKEIVLSAGAVSRCNRMAELPSGEKSLKIQKLVSFPSTPHGLGHWTKRTTSPARHSRHFGPCRRRPKPMGG
jgi:choline dehydrogenase